MEQPVDALTPPDRDALVALARAAADGFSECIAVPSGLDPARLAAATDAGLVETCDEGFVFLSPDAHSQALALAFLPDAQRAWNDAAALVTVLHALWDAQDQGKAGYDPPSVYPGARLLLGLRSAGLNVAARLPALVAADYPAPGELPPDDEGNRLHQRAIATQQAAAGALALLDPLPEEVLAFGVACGEYLQDSNGVGSDYVGLATLARLHPQTARRVLALVEDDPTDDAVALAPHLLHGLSTVDLDDALRRALALTESARPALVRAGVFALGSLAASQDDARVDAVLDRLDALSAAPDVNLDRPLARALGAFPLRVSPQRALGLLIRLAARPSAASSVARAIADLAVRSGPDVYRAALLSLAASTHLDAAGAEALRSILYRVPPPLVLDVAEQWARTRVRDKPSLPDAFGYALDKVPRADLDARLLRWFASGEAPLAQVAADVVNDPRRMGGQWAFSPHALSGLDARQLLHVARQVFGRVHDGRTLTRLCLSFYDRPALPPEVAAFVSDRLEDFVAFTRPAEAHDVLSAVDPAQHPAAAAVAAKVLGRIQTRSDAYRALPRRTELASPLARVHSFVTAERRRNDAIRKRVERESDFGLKDLFTQVAVRGGKGFLYETHEGTLETSLFELHQTDGFSLFGDLVDPVGQAYRRLVWMSTPLPAPSARASALTSPDGVRSARASHRRRRPTRRLPGRRRPTRPSPRRR